MFSINTNNNALAALQSLQGTQAALSATQNAISSGKKVATASDNPAIYSISQTMQGQIAGLTAVSDSLNFGQSVVSTALSATSSISAALISLRQTVTNGQQTGIDPTVINAQIKQVSSLITQYANAATFNGVNLLSTSANSSDITNTTLNVVQGVQGNVLTIASALAANANILQALGLNNLQANSSATSTAFSAAAAFASGDTMVINGTDSTGAAHSWTFEFTDGTAALTAIPSATSTVVGVQLATTDSNSAALSKLVTALQTQGFASAVDSTGNLVVSGNGSTAAGTTTTLATGTATSTAISGTSGAVAIVAAAITKMDSISATLGSNSQQITGMQTFTSALQTSLTTGVGALVDADMASESAMLTSLQTKQSLAIQALSIANQQPQSLLTLFR